MAPRQQIASGARARGLDPAAVLAVASVEGLGGGVGDRGTSFGPFQLHVGGALPRGIRNPQQWANSPAGINYALDQIARVARGLHGRQAVSAIVSRFERPANIPGEIASASGRLGQFGGGVAPALPRPPAPSAGGLAATPGIAQTLMGLATQQHPDYRPLFGLVQQAKQSPQTPQAPRQTLGNVAAGPQRGLGRAILAPGADRPGVKTSPAVLRFVQRIAGLAGHPLTIGTGSNHNRMTVNGRVSDHWAGHAADISATGQQLVELGRWALIAAGANPRWALKQTGGLFNLTLNGRQIQVIFNTHEGGDHTNHLHVGLH